MSLAHSAHRGGFRATGSHSVTSLNTDQGRDAWWLSKAQRNRAQHTKPPATAGVCHLSEAASVIQLGTGHSLQATGNAVAGQELFSA